MGFNPSDVVSSILHAQINKRRLIPKPSGFSWNPPIQFYRDSATGEIIASKDVSTFQPTGKAYYVSMTGNNSNDGLTPATALRTVSVACQKADVVEVWVGAGYYDDQYGMNQVDLQKNISIKAMPGEDVTISTSRTVAWTKTAGYTNVYQASRTIVAAVYDSYVLNGNGDFTKMISVASIAAVDTTPGSYYYDGSIVYVHTCDSRPAGSSVRVFLDLYNIRNVGSYTIYTEGIKWYGGNNGCVYVLSSVSGLFVAKNCEFKYSTGGNGGISINGWDAYLQNCIAAVNENDGFNYHIQGSLTPKAIEINCIGRNNGVTSDTDNGSTMHDGGKIVRVNGRYYENMGPNVHDINAGTQTWNIACVAANSLTTAENRNANFYVENDTESWFDSCVAIGSEVSMRTVNGTATKAYIRNTNLAGKELITNGTITPY